MIISLCGFMGAGKSTIGKNLARYTGFRFIDLDNYIEHKTGRTVSDFFEKNGEYTFRLIELEALREIVFSAGGKSSRAYSEHSGASRYFRDINDNNTADEEKDFDLNVEHHINSVWRNENRKGIILALGGGTVITPECAGIIKEHTFCIYLNCPKNILLRRLIKNNIKRPLLAGKTSAELKAYITELIRIREPDYKQCAHLSLNISEDDKLLEIIEKLAGYIKVYLCRSDI